MKPKTLKMLIVDDDSFISTLVRDFFTASGYNYDFITSEDGEEALQVCIREKPDVIITDLMLPKLSGIDFIATLRAMPEFAVTPILAISAGTEALKEEAKLAGAHMVLSKPIRRLDLLQKVDELLLATPFIRR